MGNGKLVCTKIAYALDDNSDCKCVEIDSTLRWICSNTDGVVIETKLKNPSTCPIIFVYDGRLIF